MTFIEIVNKVKVEAAELHEEIGYVLEIRVDGDYIKEIEEVLEVCYSTKKTLGCK